MNGVVPVKWRCVAVALCLVILALAPLCFASPSAGVHHMHGPLGAAVAHHADMYQSFVTALLIFVVSLILAVFFAHASFQGIALAGSITAPCVSARCRDPGLAHKIRFLRYVTRLLHAPPIAAS